MGAQWGIAKEGRSHLQPCRWGHGDHSLCQRLVTRAALPCEAGMGVQLAEALILEVSEG